MFPFDGMFRNTPELMLDLTVIRLMVELMFPQE